MDIFLKMLEYKCADKKSKLVQIRSYTKWWAATRDTPGGAWITTLGFKLGAEVD